MADVIIVHGIHYTKLSGGRYKYKLAADYEVEIPIERTVTHKYMALTQAGRLTVKARYKWDGPSGPTTDTENFMRGSLVHDALYQMLRERLLPWEHRDPADRLLRKMCRRDGMSAFRAWYVYWAVHLFGAGAARPR